MVGVPSARAQSPLARGLPAQPTAGKPTAPSHQAAPAHGPHQASPWWVRFPHSAEDTLGAPRSGAARRARMRGPPARLPYLEQRGDVRPLQGLLQAEGEQHLGLCVPEEVALLVCGRTVRRSGWGPAAWCRHCGPTPRAEPPQVRAGPVETPGRPSPQHPCPGPSAPGGSPAPDRQTPRRQHVPCVRAVAARTSGTLDSIS